MGRDHRPSHPWGLRAFGGDRRAVGCGCTPPARRRRGLVVVVREQRLDQPQLLEQTQVDVFENLADRSGRRLGIGGKRDRGKARL